MGWREWNRRWRDKNVKEYQGLSEEGMSDGRNLPPAYVSIYLNLVAVAKDCGYALCVHGSLARDLDLVAVPWTAEAIDEGRLAEALVLACSGHMGIPSANASHGRLQYPILLGGDWYIDLSVMPRRCAKKDKDAIGECPSGSGGAS